MSQKTENTLEKYKPEQILEKDNPIKADIQSLDNLDQSDPITKVNPQQILETGNPIKADIQSLDNLNESDPITKVNPEQILGKGNPIKAGIKLESKTEEIRRKIDEIFENYKQQQILETGNPIKAGIEFANKGDIRTQIDEILEKYNPEQILGRGNPIKGDIKSLHNLGEFSPITQVHIRRKFWAGKAKLIIEDLQSMPSSINSFKINNIFAWGPYEARQLMQSNIDSAIVELENIKKKVRYNSTGNE